MPTCPSCQAVTSKKGNCSDCDSLETMLAKLNSKVEDILKQNADIIRALEFNTTSLEELKTQMSGIDTKIGDLQQRVDSLEGAARGVKEENTQLKERVNLAEQRLLDVTNTIEIQGVPRQANEDLLQTVCNIASALDAPITRESITAAYRIQRRTGNLHDPPAIVVRLQQQSAKEMVLAKRRVKRNFSTSDIGLAGATGAIYVNEALTPYFKKVYYEANKLKKSQRIKFLWVRNGSIFIRKAEGEPKNIILSIEQLKNF